MTITPEKIYEVFGITPGPWEYKYEWKDEGDWRQRGYYSGRIQICGDPLYPGDNNFYANGCLFTQSPTMLVALVRIQLFAESEYNTEVSETYYKSIIEAADHKKRPWPELKKELLS